MPRNSNSVVTTVPSYTKKRSKIRIGPVDNFSSSQHGRLVPNFVKPVFPGDTFTMKDFASFCYADKSEKLPLSSIYFDQFFFFVPYRLIDRDNWPKVLGYRDNILDKKIYSVPQIDLTMDFDTVRNNADTDDYYATEDIDRIMISFLPQYLNNCCPNSEDDISLTGSAYPLLAYWLIWNEFFRSEQLDNVIDLTTALANLEDFELYDNIFAESTLEDIITTLEGFHLIPERVNKLPDIMTRGMISPQRSPDGQPVPLFLGGAAPLAGTIGFKSADGQALPAGLQDVYASAVQGAGGKVDLYTEDGVDGIQIDASAAYVDLSEATAVDINALRLAFSIQALYETKGKFGTRYISYIRGVWGVIVPDSAIDRPEYLGGCRVELNNMPVLNTASDLGLFSGYSATLFNGAQFDKTFLEYGLIIGVHCERVHHVYPQGCDLDVWDKLVELDFYNPQFAELGYMGQKKSLIFNGNTSIFNYNEAWPLERAQLSRASGIFGSLGGAIFQDYREKYLYADFYDEAPTFNSVWLKEPTENVARTMTGELIVGANNPVWGHQYMFDFKFIYDITRVIPVYSEPATL